MRYGLSFERLVNRLVPHYLGGRQLLMLLHGISYPLQVVNDRFVLFARQKMVEAAMTSQIILFEHFLNSRFSRYFADRQDRIFIMDGRDAGVDLYMQDSTIGRPYTLWFNHELIPAGTPDDERPKEFYHQSETREAGKGSFIVSCPAITGIELSDFVNMLSSVVNVYKLAGKTYIIKINSTEIEPVGSGLTQNHSKV